MILFFEGYLGCYKEYEFNDVINASLCVSIQSSNANTYCIPSSLSSNSMNVNLCRKICQTDNGFKYFGLRE